MVGLWIAIKWLSGLGGDAGAAMERADRDRGGGWEDKRSP